MMRVCRPFLNQYYALVTEDSYSKLPEVYFTKCATAKFTITPLRQLFAREEIPHVLVTDKATLFNDHGLESWLKSIGVTHLFTAPRHPTPKWPNRKVCPNQKKTSSTQQKTW